jgi:hypothetical protein
VPLPLTSRVTSSAGAAAALPGVIALWDAERTDLITIATGVSAWVDSKSALSVTQATGASQPVWSATSFGGGASLAFDGVAQTLALTLAGQFPAAGEPGELWCVCSNTADSADAGLRNAVTYGSGSGATNRSIIRAIATNVRVRGVVGDGTVVANATASATTNFVSRHVIRLRVGLTVATLFIDGRPATSIVVTPNTTATRIRIGSTPATTPLLFWQGNINLVAVTRLLSAPEVARMWAACLPRRRL